jgi:adenine/guanine phosphoribosyltransferase-like PRPP-binding protein
MNLYSTYLPLDPKELRKIVRRIVPTVKKLQSEIKFDSIAIRGMSGAAIGFPLSIRTQIPLVIVRKIINNEHHSHGSVLEGCTNIERYMILDDFAASGETMKSIISTIKEKAFDYSVKTPTCVGIMFYNKDVVSNWCPSKYLDKIKLYQL